MRPVTLTDADGMRIYRRSLAFLLITAAAEVVPDASIYIEHSAPTLGAYYCRVRGRAPFSADELARIEERMRAIVAADERITKVPGTREQAMALFEERGERDKVRLLAHRSQESVVLYELRGPPRLPAGLHGALDALPRALPAASGIRRGSSCSIRIRPAPRELTPFEPYPRLFATFAEAGEWLDRLESAARAR